MAQVLSKSTESLDTLEVHAHPESGRWREVRVHQGDVRVRVAPFEAIELELGALWSPPRGA